MDYAQAAEQVLAAVGGKDNVSSVGHCMTRLRFTLNDEKQADDIKVKNVKGVKGISKAGGQYQVIIGSGDVDEVFNEINKLASFNQADYSDIKKQNWLDVALDYLSGSISPWLGCIMGSLIINALLSLLSSLHVLSVESPTYLFFSTMSGAITYFMPVFIGYSAADKLKTNKYMGALIGAIMIYPSLTSAIADGTVGLFGLTIRDFSYTSTILPVLFAVWFLKYVEKLAKRICPKMIYIFGVTMIELLIVVPVVFLVIGPIGSLLGTWIANFILWIHSFAGFLAPAIVSMLLPLCVMGGIHVAFMPILTMMITETGSDPIIMPSFMCYNIGVAGAALAYALRSKDADERSMGFSSSLSGILGISEPALFGVLLTHKRILATTMVGMFISGAITGLVGYTVSVPISQSIFSIPAAGSSENMIACLISFAVSFIAPFITTFFFGNDKKTKAIA